MLNKMRRRFVLSAMLAIGTVVLALLCAIFWGTWSLTAWRQDAALRGLMELGEEELTVSVAVGPAASSGERFEPARPDREPPPRLFTWGGSRELGYMLRFFIVYCGRDGRVLDTDQDYIASVTAEEAAGYAEDALRTGKRSGYCGSYRFLVTPTQDGFTAAFLNSERELQSMRGLVLVSGTVALLSMLAVFFLVLLFSRRAIAPYVKNIETQKRFITDAGHELKTPITSIATSADLLAMDGPDSEWVRNIQAQCARLTRLVGNLVTLSRLDEDQPFPEKAEFSLSEAIWEISEPAAALARAKGKTYTQEIEDGMTLRGDRSAVQQMISILLDNAVRYSGPGGTIRLAARTRQKKREITVYNTCDLPKGEDVSRFFDRFYRPDRSRSTETGGTGIGLSIAKATAEAHGGTIAAKAADGGIEFAARL